MRLPRLSAVLGCAMLCIVPAAHVTPVHAEEKSSSAVKPAKKSPEKADKAAQRHIKYTAWDTDAELSKGKMAGLAVRGSQLHLENPKGKRNLDGKTFEQGTWDSPWVKTGFGLTELIPSWSANTPGDTRIEVRVRAKVGTGKPGTWDLMASWATGDRYVKRATGGSQPDDLGRANVDTWVANDPDGVTAYQVRVQVLRKVGSKAKPTVDTIGAVASRLPKGKVKASSPTPVAGKVLKVPGYSQMIHRGHYPQWGNGGEAWCSPTSTSMVMGYYGKLPARSSYPWIPAGHPDAFVDLAARVTYDHAYQGAGNWAFNTAYAAPRVGNAFVTRLRSLREAERFIDKGIPLVASLSWGSGELTGAPINSSAGHLMVIVGFTKAGDVVVNDPAAPNNATVRRTYDRAQFENAWLPKSGGTVYVIHDDAHPLPKPGVQANW